MNPSFLEQFDTYKTSQNIALVCGDTSLTYEELHIRCFTLASKLRSLGVGVCSTAPESYDIFAPKAAQYSPWVVIVSDRSENAVIGIIAAWMAGGSYVLMGSDVPDAYLNGILEDTAAVVIRNGELCEGEENGSFTYTFPQDNEIACAIFTSGTTGKPKGAVLEHRVINEMLRWQTEYMKPFGWTATAAYAPLGFIAAIWELFFPLANGLTLHMPDDATRHDLFALERYIEKNNISYMFLPPNIAEVFTQTYRGNSLKYLRVAGGRLKACGDIEGRYEIMYHLGMAENGGSVTFKPLKTAISGDIPIGKAWNKTVVRLDDETGEMLVSGPSLFRGYMARKDETERRLINGEYHSGDLARLDENQELIHIGRKDLTVKIRDMKVNPAQVESALGECTGVSECCVTAQDNALIGWFAGGADETSLRTELSAWLPEYMVPLVFVKLEKLPRNSNGKIDRQALHYSPREDKAVNLAGMSETERQIAGLFERLLGLTVRSVGAEDSFLRLGGDSLGFMRLQAELARVFSRNIPYTALFENPTACGIAGLLQSQTEFSPIPVAPSLKLTTAQIAYPLSAPMRQMWLLWRTGQDGGKYTVSIKCRFMGGIDKSRTVAAFTELTRHNAILRSRFIEHGGEVYQVIEESVAVAIQKTPRSMFDLSEAPAFDMTLTGNTLCFTTHHIIADATGLRLLMEDFWALYGGRQPQTSAQAHDVTMWTLNKYSSADEAYWISMFSGKPRSSALPYDFECPDRLTTASREIVFLSEADTVRLREYAASRNTTLFQLFLAAYALLLSKHTGGDVVVGVPFSGREHPDTARTIGMLVRTLPIKLDVYGMSFDEALAHTRERFMGAWEHQEVSLERLTEIINIHRTTARNPFYDVMINYIPLPRPLPDVEGLQPEIIRDEYPAALFDFVLELREETYGLTAAFTYSDELFKSESIRNIADDFRTLLLTHELEINRVYAMPLTEKQNKGAVIDETTPQLCELLRIWKDILGAEAVSSEDDFFTAGGTSLDAIRIEAALFEKGWLLSAADIFQNPKLCKMASLMAPAEEFDWEEDA